MRQQIIIEIKRLARENGGCAPGVAAFAKATGITQGNWRGVYWARWSDALTEAGFSPNVLNTKRDSGEILRYVAALCKDLGRMPTYSDMRLHKRTDLSFPNDKTIANHFGNIADLINALYQLADDDQDQDLRLSLPPRREENLFFQSKGDINGHVYLLKSGIHFKIGCTTNIERRVKEISVAMPEPLTLIHSIRTDDPSGIEAYWHRRFADRRANGEWFKLSAEDLKAFRRRLFQ